MEYLGETQCENGGMCVYLVSEEADSHDTSLHSFLHSTSQHLVTFLRLY